MNRHVASVTQFRRPLEALSREDIVKTMAEHLVAAVLHNSLDTSSDIDVIQCLLDIPDRFNHRVVLDHMDSAKYEADQMLIAREMGED